jgi:putative hydrolase of the HAD superfamily
VLALVREVRAGGIPVGLATNATDALDADLADLGLLDEFDVVVNSSVLGAHKPTKEYFVEACRAVGAAPARTLFVDDDDRSVGGARAAGLSAYRWDGPAGLPYLRAALTM